ncbi:MAG: DNA repair protein RadC [Gemmatimonadetes bacterium]|nr:DNA repair protein RadC [Gemmatimonadota bacterium]
MGELDLLIGLFSGARKSSHVDPVCTTNPSCGACSVAPYCTYVRYRTAPPSVPATRSIKEWAVDERPRERLLAGERLSNAELLAIILRNGSGGSSALDLARELLARFKTLHRLGSAGVDEISGVRGIGPAKAAEIRAALELGRRVMQPENDDRDGLRTVTSSRDVFDFYRPRYKNATQEEFVLLALNTKNRITREVTISVGTLNSSIVHPRDVFNHALREAAAGVIFLHNHPSGDPAPSREDITLTTRLCEAGRLLGIKVLDHVIVGATRYYSFADEGALG